MQWLLTGVIIILIIYIGMIRKQIRNISQQMSVRIVKEVNSPVQLELFDTQLNELVVKVNEILALEQKTRQQILLDQQYYKEMISNISHDFRTPLTAVKGYQQLLLKEPLTDEQREKLQVANSHVINLEGLLETFFEYSYLLSQREEPQIEQVRLDLIVEEYVAGLYTQFEQKGISVEIVAEDGSLLLNSDSSMLRRIVQNLLTNALQHSEYAVTVQFSQDETYTYFSVRNRVDHIELIHPEQLFERFYTKDRTRKHSSGLGLSIVRLLSERLGGSATATIEGDYLVFTIKLLNNGEVIRG